MSERADRRRREPRSSATAFFNRRNRGALRRRFDARGIAIALFLFAGMLSAERAGAVEWQPVAPGIDYFHRRTEAPQEIFALRIDLGETALEVKPALAGDAVFGDYSTRETVSQLAARKGAFAGVNADYFGTDHNVEGWFFLDGERRYAPPVTERSCVNISPARAVDIGVISPDLRPDIQFYQCVGGGPKLLFAGLVRWERSGDIINGERLENSSGWDSRQPWTAIGMGEDGRTMLWAVVDGRQPGYSVGMTPWEMGALLAELGAYEGMKFDGGGSSTFVLDGRVLNSPSDGTERRVGNALLVYSAGPVFTATPLPTATPTPVVYFGGEDVFRFSAAWSRVRGETEFAAEYDVTRDDAIDAMDLYLLIRTRHGAGR